MKPPVRPIIPASAAIAFTTCPFEAPIARSSPSSRVRSSTAASSVFTTPRSASSTAIASSA